MRRASRVFGRRTRPRKATAIIPARLGSTRLPRKVLLAETGRPLIAHVCERAAAAGCVGRVVVATDSEEVAGAVHGAGHEAVMTSAAHENGTSRVAEAARTLGLGGPDVIVNVQGDEPEVDAGTIDAAVHAIDWPQREQHGSVEQLDDDLWFATVASPFGPGEDPQNPSIVKVVTSMPEDGVARALYFSRAAIPQDRDGVGAVRLKHIGVYAYTMSALVRYSHDLASTPLERAERLEQLRWLEHAYMLAVAIRSATHHGIDTPADYAAFVARWRAGQ